MIHGPYDIDNPRAWCMVNGVCSKRYPKEFHEETMLDRNGYPIYRRRNNGMRIDLGGGRFVTNHNVIPFNPFLSQKYDCHFNIEICASVCAIKYIHKYIYKDHD